MATARAPPPRRGVWSAGRRGLAEAGAAAGAGVAGMGAVGGVSVVMRGMLAGHTPTHGIHTSTTRERDPCRGGQQVARKSRACDDDTLEAGGQGDVPESLAAAHG